MQLNLYINNALGKKGKRSGQEIPPSGEKGPADNPVTVARRHRGALAGCRKTFQAEENFDGRHIRDRGAGRQDERDGARPRNGLSASLSCQQRAD